MALNLKLTLFKLNKHNISNLVVNFERIIRVVSIFYRGSLTVALFWETLLLL